MKISEILAKENEVQRVLHIKSKPAKKRGRYSNLSSNDKGRILQQEKNKCEKGGI